MKKPVVIGILIAILVLALIASVLYFRKAQIAKTSVAPTPINTIIPTPTSSYTRAATPDDARLEKIMKEQLPIQNENVEIAYSPLIKKFYIYKKTSVADRLVNNFFQKNKLQDIIDTDRIIYTTKPVLPIMFSDEAKQFPNNPATKDEDI